MRIYLDLARIFLRFLFSLRILFFRHLALILYFVQAKIYNRNWKSIGIRAILLPVRGSDQQYGTTRSVWQLDLHDVKYSKWEVEYFQRIFLFETYLEVVPHSQIEQTEMEEAHENKILRLFAAKPESVN